MSADELRGRVQAARAAQRRLAAAAGEVRSEALAALGAVLEERSPAIAQANREDLAAAQAQGLAAGERFPVTGADRLAPTDRAECLDGCADDSSGRSDPRHHDPDCSLVDGSSDSSCWGAESGYDDSDGCLVDTRRWYGHLDVPCHDD